MIMRIQGVKPACPAYRQAGGRQGIEGSSEILRNYKELKIWQKS
jgi:hypothetical protein